MIPFLVNSISLISALGTYLTSFSKTCLAVLNCESYALRMKLYKSGLFCLEVCAEAAGSIDGCLIELVFEALGGGPSVVVAVSMKVSEPERERSDKGERDLGRFSSGVMLSVDD